MQNQMLLSLAKSILSLAALISLAALPASSMAAGGKPKLMPPQAVAFGETYNEWSAEWWQWELGIPRTNHPGLSLDGANCGVKQSGKVWFLTGALTTEVPQNEFNTIVRELCTIPTGKAIFFPIVNVECSTVEADPFHLIENGVGANVETCAAKFVEGPAAVIADLAVHIDGEAAADPEAFRFGSPVFDFEFDNPVDNRLEVDCNVVDCNNMRAVSDGFWILLPPLSRGMHAIRFTGSFRDPITNALLFGLDVTYELNVVRGR